MLRFAVAIVALFIAAPTFAQIIYEPVTYQYSTGIGNQHFYYGGNNPAALAYLHSKYACKALQHGTTAGNGPNFFGGVAPKPHHAAVYTDCVGGGIADVSYFGWSATNARNEAYANSATYFSKANALACATRGADGAWHISPDAGEYAPPRVVHVRPTTRPAPAATTETMMPKPGQIIIIPKSLLDRPLKDFMAKPDKVAMAK